MDRYDRLAASIAGLLTEKQKYDADQADQTAYLSEADNLFGVLVDEFDGERDSITVHAIDNIMIEFDHHVEGIKDGVTAEYLRSRDLPDFALAVLVAKILLGYYNLPNLAMLANFHRFAENFKAVVLR